MKTILGLGGGSAVVQADCHWRHGHRYCEPNVVIDLDHRHRHYRRWHDRDHDPDDHHVEHHDQDDHHDHDHDHK